MLLNVSEARKNISMAIDAACAGEGVVITRRNKPVVRLVPYYDGMEIKEFPSMKRFRGLLESSGNPSPSAVERLREGERYA